MAGSGQNRGQSVADLWPFGISDMDAQEVIRVYRQQDFVFRAASKLMKTWLEHAFEGELRKLGRQGQNILDPEVRVGAAKHALKKIQLPVLKGDGDIFPALVRQEVLRLATAVGRDPSSHKA